MKSTDGTKCGAALTGCSTTKNDNLGQCDVCDSATTMKTTDETKCGVALTGCVSLDDSDLTLCDVC